MVKERLEKKYPADEDKQQCPSLEWIRLQFWPPNPYSSTALQYTSQFEPRFGVQAQQLRLSHPDSKYVSVLLKYLKSFTVKFCHLTTYASIDDKAILPLGEPGLPISTGVWGHNRSIVPLQRESTPVALDHNFHVHGIVPSVSFFVSVPEFVSDSFYTGKAFVCCKGKVIQASDPFRHSSELASILRMNMSEDRTVPDKPVLVIVSDGGPDHRISYVSVQVALIALMMELHLDMFICARTCAYQSWQNIAERIMSTLNLALMNVSLCRTQLPDGHEETVHSMTTLTDLRKLISEKPLLKMLVRDSVQQALCTLQSRIACMEIKGERIGIAEPSSDEDIEKPSKECCLLSQIYSEISD